MFLGTRESAMASRLGTLSGRRPSREEEDLLFGDDAPGGPFELLTGPPRPPNFSGA